VVLGRDSAVVAAKFTSLGQGRGTLIFVDDTSAAARQAQQLKLASLGRLSASIAHEIRNPLGAISHAAQLLGESPCLGVGERRLVEILLNHCARVNGIVKNVLHLSRRKPSQVQALELRPWLERFCEEFCGSKGMAPDAVVFQLAAPEMRIEVDPSQLQQILWNLCDNAWRHSQGGGAPRLQLKAGITAPQGQAWIEVLDTGPGIPAEIADQIFEPFFTAQRAGTGLGLYVARELAECNGAHLEYQPGVKGGSCFRLCFSRGERREVNAP
jgi:two-component system, NtrC family, sensor histidine kinase PilS